MLPMECNKADQNTCLPVQITQLACLHRRMGASMHDRSYFCIARLLVVNTGEDTELEERSSGRWGQQHESRLTQQARLVTV